MLEVAEGSASEHIPGAAPTAVRLGGRVQRPYRRICSTRRANRSDCDEFRVAATPTAHDRKRRRW